MPPSNYFDDVMNGDERLTPLLTVTEKQILTFAGVAGDCSPIHLDDLYAKSTHSGGHIAHGLGGSRSLMG
jgi:acyl dehydratase